MDAVRRIAEKRIKEAMQRGAFDNLPGAGKPLVLADDSLVPEHLRMAHTILKNAGMLPPELEERKEVSTILDLLQDCSDEKVIYIQMQKLKLLIENITSRGLQPVHLADRYYMKILERIPVRCAHSR